MRDRKRLQVRFGIGPWSSSGWCRDDLDRLILMRVPEQIDLNSPMIQQAEPVKLQSPLPEDTTSSLTSHAASLTNLPRELIHEIAWHMHPVDRVCLALTCKTLTSHILSAPLLSPTTWGPFSDTRYLGFLPESYSLILRLAHGWVPKDKLRYCSRCHRILPRDESYFRKRMSLKKKPRWSIKVRMDKNLWDGMSKRARYAHLINDWCNTSVDDGSILCCDICRNKAMASGDDRLQHPPAQCPECLEKELTYIWKIPRKPWFREKVARVFMALYHPCEYVVCFLGWCCFYGVRFVCREGRQCWRKMTVCLL